MHEAWYREFEENAQLKALGKWIDLALAVAAALKGRLQPS